MPGARDGFLNLNAYLRNSGYHESAWKVSDADPASVIDVGHYVHLARVAERGAIEAIFLPDSPGEAEFRSTPPSCTRPATTGASSTSPASPSRPRAAGAVVRARRHRG